MELNLCLYCEKRLVDDNIAFCSVSCQSNEASKSSSFIQIQPTSINHSSSNPTLLQKSYSMSYHRSPSLSYSTSTITSSSRRKRKESSPASLSSSLSHQTHARTSPPFFLMQSISTSSSFSSSLSDISSVFSSASCSCEDKASICAPYHITSTTQNIAS
ncbi:uncharacterized protein ATC70_006286 [Mucor velutinosus]|uniref:Uncharacterized protein n=1 Tax=Mucor velutinosus TaxID=708070 RepID=A0AAN7D765_9FUNG|nr:hypothetical protein ATC70_006286 [Mucor velutinosus]